MQRGNCSVSSLRFFPCFFLSCKANVRVLLAKTGHGPHFQNCTLYVLCVCCKCVVWCCHRVSTQLRLNKYHIISYRYTSVCVRVSKQWRFGVETRIFERRFFCFLIQPYQWVLRGLSKYNENFSGRRSLQDVNVVEPPPPSQQHILKMGTDLVPETSDKLHTLTWLSAR